jgi:MYXO-CTERM domain-containing protein
MITVDTVAPTVHVALSLEGNVLRARVSDLIGPAHVHDFQKVVVVAGATEIPMQWYGEMLWRAAIPIEAMSATYQVCATDRQGNKGCATNAPTGDADAGVGGDAGDVVHPPGDGGGGCCQAGGNDPRGALALGALVAITWRRRRPRGARRTSRAA